MSTRRWFLPRTPDVLGALRAQTDATVAGLDALAEWAAGDEKAAARVRECEHLADDRKRELRLALSEAFSTPLEPEDIFQLSGGLDRVMNAAKNIVREAEVLGKAPDPPMAELAAALAEGTHHIADAFAALGEGGGTRRPPPPTPRSRASAASNAPTGQACWASPSRPTCTRSPRAASSTAVSRGRATAWWTSPSGSGTRSSRRAEKLGSDPVVCKDECPPHLVVQRLLRFPIRGDSSSPSNPSSSFA